MDAPISLAPRTWKIIGIALAALVLLGLVLFAADRYSQWTNKRSITKHKDKIANTVSEIQNIDSQVANLKEQKAEKQGELNRDLEELQRNIYGQDEAKQAVNAAAAKYEKALNSNSNVNATADDFRRVLEELKEP